MKRTLAAMAFLALCTGNAAADQARDNNDARAIARIRQSLKNPASFQLSEALRMDDGALCITYRATNSFNAIVPAQAVVLDGRIIASESNDDFRRAYLRHCQGRIGTDVGHLRLMTNP